MARHVPIPDFESEEPTEGELANRKRIADRAELLEHVDWILRPPAWVYEEMEIAIRRAIDDQTDQEIQSRDGVKYKVSDLVERWELGKMLDVYARPPDSPDYEPAGRPYGWNGPGAEGIGPW